jgi:energy-coupling factor transporter ATP-binding protein EcfA2
VNDTGQSSNEYADRAARFGAEAERLGARSRLVSNLRGVSFALMAVSAIVAASGKGAPVSGALALLGGLAFAALVVAHARVIRAEDDARRWARVNQDAEARVTGKWRSFFDDGARFGDAAHPYTADLDIFGRGSLFQRVCVAHTRYGQEALARFLAEPADRATIVLRQEAVRALASELDLRQRLEAEALAAIETPSESGTPTARRPPKPAPDPEPLLAWAESEPKLSASPAIVWAARILPLVTVSALVTSFFVQVPIAAWGAPLALQIVLNLATRTETTRVFVAVSATEGAFLRYGSMLSVLEGLDVESSLLADMKERVSAGGVEPSVAMAEFRRAVSWYDLRHNGLIHPFANALLSWDIHCTLMLERWQRQSGKSTRAWFRALGELEALSSFAGLSHDDPSLCFAEILDGPAVLEAEGVGHPLLDPGTRVSNDVRLLEPGRAMLVTGSNMSGKSTLLRSMGLAAVMALAGAPSAARRLRLSRLDVRTSMRISDSLASGVSHFYAEVRRLKAVLDATRGELPVLFLLDEILHGTNSRERQIGARWVLAELLAKGAVGAVSTHDMELCQLPDDLMERVEQVHFQEDVKDGKMTFDYRLRSGPVTAGNALRLMKIVGLEVPLDD